MTTRKTARGHKIQGGWSKRKKWEGFKIHVQSPGPPVESASEKIREKIKGKIGNDASRKMQETRKSTKTTQLNRKPREDEQHREIVQPRTTQNTQKKHKMSCMYTNADQLKNKLQEMKTRMSHTMPSIIGITEVKAKNRSMKMKESEFSVDEVGKYDMFCTNIEDEKGRGCILYVSQELQAVQVHFNTQFEENVFSSINLKKWWQVTGRSN